MILVYAGDSTLHNLREHIVLLRMQVVDLIQQKNEERMRPHYDPFLDFFSPLDIIFSRVIYELHIVQEHLIAILDQ